MATKDEHDYATKHKNMIYCHESFQCLIFKST